MNKLEEIAALYEDLDKKVASVGETLFKDFFKEIFETTPEIKAVHWQQYIPGFNDGEPCLFSINTVDVLIDGIEREADSEWFSETSYDYTKNDDTIDIEAMTEEYPCFQNSANWYVATNHFDVDWHYEKGKGRYSTPSGVEEHICKSVERIHKTIHNNGQACQSVFGANAEILITPEKIVVEEYDCGW